MKPFTTVAVVLFGLVALAHLLRLLMGWEITINGVLIPLWVSLLGFIIPAGLALMLWRESTK